MADCKSGAACKSAWQRSTRGVPAESSITSFRFPSYGRLSPEVGGSVFGANRLDCNSGEPMLPQTALLGRLSSAQGTPILHGPGSVRFLLGFMDQGRTHILGTTNKCRALLRVPFFKCILGWASSLQ